MSFGLRRQKARTDKIRIALTAKRGERKDGYADELTVICLAAKRAPKDAEGRPRAVEGFFLKASIFFFTILESFTSLRKPHDWGMSAEL